MVQVHMDLSLEGRVLAEDIYNAYGVLLLSKGTVLTSKEIAKLKGNGFQSVNVKEIPHNQEDDRYLRKQFQQISANKHLVETYMNATQTLKSLYTSVTHQYMPPIHEFEQLYETLRDQVISQRDLFRSLYLLEGSENYTYRHSINVGILSAIIANLVGMPQEEVEMMGVAGLLHDIGKMLVPSKIVMKPDRLTEDEFEIMKLHTVYGHDLFQKSGEFPDVFAQIALLHHERMDGSGYPEQRIGDEIPLSCQIVAIADMFDAICSDRIYKERTSPFEAAQLLWNDACTGKLNPKIVSTFMQSIISMYIGSRALLSNGDEVEIVLINADEPMRPLVRKGTEYFDLRNKRDLHLQKMIL
ncbi:HD-GYP domain-containing protein [Brevibacillus halotolerans]|uniref:HD-GYP domain-containing protein n=1 Tax=Brevibacillus TaxID=55080 RepID=UPI0002D32626|nr:MULTISPECIES: HD-GYP domain-containing protein [Brevibacillus]MCR8964039.1 HD-GYP domain-containing protein [Brevibacillus laterosporus]MCR8996780.1 HD-GYP domain-containing protein [Brevibacillus laterosporus]MCZ0836194.1 HD-GYP domain-containing protein [Brevibacillus halotolerans]MDF9413446.1 HD-GYP domain-containing protein [Brevibacillus laterosporus]PCN42488.1 HDIG domain-containing protein [Brevibacillus laterosporus]